MYEEVNIPLFFSFFSDESVEVMTDHYQWRIPDFPRGAPTPKVGVLTYFFGRKLHENERIWTPGGARPRRPPLDPPLITEEFSSLQVRAVDTETTMQTVSPRTVPTPAGCSTAAPCALTSTCCHLCSRSSS